VSPELSVADLSRVIKRIEEKSVCGRPRRPASQTSSAAAYRGLRAAVSSFGASRSSPVSVTVPRRSARLLRSFPRA
jgi:hypothetical protein